MGRTMEKDTPAPKLKWIDTLEADLEQCGQRIGLKENKNTKRLREVVETAKAFNWP